jgi:hypothetical protein
LAKGDTPVAPRGVIMSTSCGATAKVSPAGSDKDNDGDWPAWAAGDCVAAATAAGGDGIGNVNPWPLWRRLEDEDPVILHGPFEACIRSSTQVRGGTSDENRFITRTVYRTIVLFL